MTSPSWWPERGLTKRARNDTPVVRTRPESLRGGWSTCLSARLEFHLGVEIDRRDAQSVSNGTKKFHSRISSAALEHLDRAPHDTRLLRQLNLRPASRYAQTPHVGADIAKDHFRLRRSQLRHGIDSSADMQRSRRALINPILFTYPEAPSTPAYTLRQIIARGCGA